MTCEENGQIPAVAVSLSYTAHSKRVPTADLSMIDSPSFFRPSVYQSLAY